MKETEKRPKRVLAFGRVTDEDTWERVQELVRVEVERRQKQSVRRVAVN